MIKKSYLKAKTKLVKDLEKIFKMAMLAKDYKSAITAKQMIAKVQGFFDDSKDISLSKLSNEQIDKLILEVESEVQN